MIKLAIEQVIALHDELIRETGGLSGLRALDFSNRLLSAPFAAFDGVSAYPTIEAKAARLAYGLIKNHPFADGNKRIGILAALSFLELNGIEISANDEELIALGLSLANGGITDQEALRWIISHS
jgi:death-on-curing protein